jgi:hypothetical protein
LFVRTMLAYVAAALAGYAVLAARARRVGARA